MKNSLLLIYKNEGLSDVFEKELRKCNYNVTSLIVHPINYRNFSITQKFRNIFNRLVFKNKNYIHNIYFEIFEKHCKSRIKEIEKANIRFDYCLVIHGGNIPLTILEKARALSNKMVDYQPDGVHNNDPILKRTDLFDNIFVFDKNDLEKYPDANFKHENNFYIKPVDLDCKKGNYDLFYVGAYLDDRKNILENLHQNLSPFLKTKFILGISQWDSRENANGIEYINSHTSYYDNLRMMQHTKALIDIKRDEHDGLSLRFFEGIGYNKKVITNNNTVKNFDFYHPDNIFITQDFTEVSEIIDFLDKPYHPLPESIKEHYSFNSWIKRIFS